MRVLSRLLGHPLLRGLPLDDPRTTALRRRITREKAFLRRLYEEWYRLLAGALPAGGGAVLEVGSGGGFLKELIPEALASDVFPTPGVDVVLDAARLPLRPAALRALLLVNVLHHLPDPAAFLREAARGVRRGGRCLMIEPWHNRWSCWVYRHLHHEPFDPGAGWSGPSGGPLSGANGALPWIIFERDRELFARRHPEWGVLGVAPLMPAAYLLSGGVSLRSLLPGWVYAGARRIERLLPGAERRGGMFAFIALERRA